MAWGANYDYELGVGTDDNSNAPIVVRGPDDLHSISAWGPQAMAVGANGNAYAWGDDSFGQSSGSYDPCCNTAVGKPYDLEVKATAVAQGGNYAIRPDGTVVGWGGGDGYKVLENIGNVQSLAVGGGFFGGGFYLALLKDGTVKSWGNNQYGQLGLGNTQDRVTPKTIPGLTGVKAIGAGNGQGLALMDDGTVKRWGGLFSSVGSPDSTLLVPTTVPGISTATEISLGYSHALVLLADGTIKAWGQNFFGILGDGTQTGSNDPVTVSGVSDAISVASGTAHSLALRADGTVMAWGRNDQGQLGIDGIDFSLTPVAVTALQGITSIAASDQSSYATQQKSQPVARVSARIDPASEYWNQIDGSGMGYTSYGDQSYPVGVVVRYTAPLDARYAYFTGWSGLWCTDLGLRRYPDRGRDSPGPTGLFPDYYRVAPEVNLYSKQFDRRKAKVTFGFRLKGPGQHTAGAHAECRLVRKSPPAGPASRPFRFCQAFQNPYRKQYKGLKPGRYVFEIRGVNRFGTGTKTERYAFRIKQLRSGSKVG